MEIRTTDYHTAGEPFRIVEDGVPDIPGATVRPGIGSGGSTTIRNGSPAVW